jgi:sugar phosphate isomerase/epimerase
MHSRRQFLKLGAGALAARLAMAKRSGLKIGIVDWNLNLTAKLEAVALASKLGFDGVQVSLGAKPVADKLPLDNAESQAQYLAASKQHSVKLDSTCLDILHVNYLKNDKLGAKWVADGIRVTRALKTEVMLLPFFGKGGLETTQEMDHVGDALRELAPEAEKAGVILGLEDTISAENNARILDRAKSKAVQVYYDVGEAHLAGFDVIKEIRWLGVKRICQFHLKDDPHHLGEGDIDFTAVLHTIQSIGYHGYANLETDLESKAPEPDLRRNLAFVRRLLEQG